jgi:hypothetical protein
MRYDRTGRAWYFLGGVCLIALALAIEAGVADQPPLDDGRLEAKSTHVVWGKVKGVYASVAEKDNGVTTYVIEIDVRGVQKEPPNEPKGPKALEVLCVRCWKRKEKSEDPAVSNGQTRIPAVAERVRVFLKRGKDGGYDVLEPNGIGRPPTDK